VAELILINQLSPLAERYLLLQEQEIARLQQQISELSSAKVLICSQDGFSRFDLMTKHGLDCVGSSPRSSSCI
jgi:hypothetical protein